MLADLLRFFSASYIARHDDLRGAAVHDPCAVLALTHPDLFRRRARHVAVETSGSLTRGMTVIDRRTLIERPPPNCDVLEHVDARSGVRRDHRQRCVIQSLSPGDVAVRRDRSAESCRRPRRTAVDSYPRESARTQRYTLGEPRDVVVSPDGRRIVFLRSRGGTDPVNCLWVVDAATGEERLVADPAVLLTARAETVRSTTSCRPRSGPAANGPARRPGASRRSPPTRR